MTARKSGWLVEYLVLGLIWGSSFLLIHEGLASFTPFGLVFWRLFSGALALFVLVLARKLVINRNLKQWLLVGAGGGLLDLGQRADQVGIDGDGNAGDIEVLAGPQGMHAKVGVGGHFAVAEQIVFEAEAGGGHVFCLRFYWQRRCGRHA